MVYTGPFVLKDVFFTFVFNGNDLVLFPEPDSPKDPRYLTGVSLGEGIWGFPGDPVLIDDEYIVLHPRALVKTLVVFPLWDGFQALDWDNGVIHIAIASYFAFPDEEVLVSGLRFKSPFLDRCYDVQRLVDREKTCKSGFRSPVVLTQSSPTHFEIDYKGNKVEASFDYSVSTVFHEGHQPLQIVSEMVFKFDDTGDFSLVAGLIGLAREFIRFCTQASNVDFSAVEALCRVSLDDDSDTIMLAQGSLEVNEFGFVIVGDGHDRFVPLGVVDGFEKMLLQSLANGELVLRHLPKTNESHVLTDARCILLAASFDSEIAKQYPEGIPHKPKTVEAIKIIDSCLEELADGASANFVLSKRVQWLRSVLANGDQFSARLLQFYKDHESTVQSLSSEPLTKESFTALSTRVQALRNALAHGSMDFSFSRELIGDVVLLERIIFAVQLINIGVEPEENVSSIVRKTFGLRF